MCKFSITPHAQALPLPDFVFLQSVRHEHTYYINSHVLFFASTHWTITSIRVGTAVCLFGFLLYPQGPKQCLPQSRRSTNTSSNDCMNQRQESENKQERED